MVYRLDLPDRLKLHPTSHVSFLKSCHKDRTYPSWDKTSRALSIVRKEFNQVAKLILDLKVKG